MVIYCILFVPRVNIYFYLLVAKTRVHYFNSYIVLIRLF